MDPSRIWLAAVAVSLAQAPGSGRSGMSVPPATVFEGMQRFAREGDPEKMLASLELLAPVLAEHEALFGAETVAELRARFRSRDSAELAAAAEELILRDVIVVLRGLPDATERRARSLVRAATLEWRLVEAPLTAADFRITQSVAAQLRDLRLAVDDGLPGEETRGLIDAIEAELSGLIRAPALED